MGYCDLTIPGSSPVPPTSFVSPPLQPYARIRPLTVAALLALGLIHTPAHSEELSYRVQQGDTLIGIGQRMLVKPSYWRQLMHLNNVADPYRMPIGSTLRIPVDWLEAEPRAAQVVAIAGQAQKNGGGLAPGDKVAAGSHLTTGEDGHVVLRLPDGSQLSLPARSSVRVDTLHGYRGMEGVDMGLGLEQGRVESQVVPQKGPAARFRVDTPTAIIGVRGTHFRINADAKVARTEVTEGVVGVSAEQRGTQRVGPGYGLVVEAGDSTLPKPIPLLPPPATADLPNLFEEPLLRIPLPAMAGAEAFRLQVAAEGPNAPVQLEVLQPVGEPARLAGLADGTYRLTLRAVDSHGLEGEDAYHTFRLKARPEPPFLSNPAAGGKVIAGPLQFTWTEAPEAASYRFSLTNSEHPDAPPMSVEGLTSSGYQAELPPGSYQWRVASVRADGDTGPWSAPAQFEVRPPAAIPEPPTIGDNEIQFHWAGEEGQRFEYQLADNMDFSPLLAEGESSDPSVALPLPPSGSYWLRVRGVDPDGFVTPWSGAQKLVVPAEFSPWLLLVVPLMAL